MAFGDYLREHLSLLKDASTKKGGPNQFWMILQEIAVQDILLIYPEKIGSYIAVPIYHEILRKNESQFPSNFLKKTTSNNQKRYTVLNRNLFTSNAFHPNGLANRAEIHAYKELNENKKGESIIYKGVEEYVNKSKIYN